MPGERYLADEGVDFRIVKALREVGYSIASIAEESPSIPDSEVLARAVERDIVLLTIRLAELPGSRKIQLVTEAFIEHAAEFRGSFSVLTDCALRIRRL